MWTTSLKESIACISKKRWIGSRQITAGHILENVIYLELLRRGYDVYVGKIDTFEVE